MRLVFRAFGDPTFQHLFLVGRQGFVRLRRRHHLVRIRRVDALDQFAFVWLAGNDGFLFHRDLAHVQPELGLALVLVRAVAGKAVVGQDRPDVVVEAQPPLIRVGRLGGHCRSGTRENKQGECRQPQELVGCQPEQSSAPRLAVATGGQWFFRHVQVCLRRNNPSPTARWFQRFSRASYRDGLAVSGSEAIHSSSFAVLQIKWVAVVWSGRPGETAAGHGLYSPALGELADSLRIAPMPTERARALPVSSIAPVVRMNAVFQAIGAR